MVEIKKATAPAEDSGHEMKKCIAPKVVNTDIGLTVFHPVGATFVSKNNPEDVRSIGNSGVACLRLLAQGLSNKEIARTRFVEERSVKNRLSELYNILGARGRGHAIVQALRFGFIEYDDLGLVGLDDPQRAKDGM